MSEVSGTRRRVTRFEQRIQEVAWDLSKSANLITRCDGDSEAEAFENLRVKLAQIKVDLEVLLAGISEA